MNTFLTDIVNNGAKISPMIRARESKLGGTGIFAITDIPENEVLMKIPKHLCLSPKTCGIANLLVRSDLEPMPSAAVAYIFEKRQGAESPWASFIQFIEESNLPGLPRSWSSEIQVLMDNCDIVRIGGLENETIERDYEEVNLFVQQNRCYIDVISFAEYETTIRRLASRVFDVDNYHELALVPGACLFNHSDSEDVHFECDGHVCELCGCLYCSCLSDFASQRDLGLDNFQGHSDNSEEASDDSPDGSDSEADNETDYDGAVCEIRAIRPIKKHKEIFNTYGETTNSVLLARYGFAIWDNRHEKVNISKQLLRRARAMDAVSRFNWWKKNYERFGDSSDTKWQDSLYVDINGRASSSACLLASLILLPPPAYIAFKNTLRLKVLSYKAANQLLKEVVQDHLEQYRVKFSSADCLQQVLNHANTEKPARQELALIVLGTEKLCLERALKRLSDNESITNLETK